MKWEYKTLDQLGMVSRGKSRHRPRNDPKLFGGEYPFIQTADVKNADYYITNYTSTYNEVGLAQSKLWDAGTLCITIAANIADSAVLSFPACFPDSVMGFVPYEGVANTRFIKSCLDILQKECKQISQGTAQDNLSWEKLSTIKFPAPPFEVQCRIGEILSVYDDLIENNHKQIKLLEEAAQRLYKEWFVDLRFSGYKDVPIVDGMPEGWAIRALSEVFTYIRGKSYSSEELSDADGILMVNLKNIRPYGGYNRNAEKRFVGQYKDDQSLEPGDIVMGVTDMTQERRLAGYTAIVPNLNESMTFSMDLIKLLPLTVDKSYLYSVMQYGGYSKIISQLANGVNVLHLKPEVMMNMNVLVPSNRVMKMYDALFKQYQEKVELLQKQCNIAFEARDRLLPKLMNGELEV